MSEWISVQERKPFTGERVLLSDGVFVGEGYLSKDGKFYRYYDISMDFLLAGEVTQWMPLPEPPRREDNEMNEISPIQLRPLADATCKIGKSGCFEDGRCHFIGDCENKIVTNGDKIRAMSDDELAKVMSNPCLGCVVKNCRLHNYGSSGCTNAFLEWLQQPAEDTV